MVLSGSPGRLTTSGSGLKRHGRRGHGLSSIDRLGWESLGSKWVPLC